MNYKLTDAEKEILDKLLSEYSFLHERLDEIENSINRISATHKELTDDYKLISEKLLSLRNEEFEFFKKMQKKYPSLQNLKELI